MVIIEMENGAKIELELYPEAAPETCKNFEKLVREGFYDGLTFHRVIKGFMIREATLSETEWAAPKRISRASFRQTDTTTL